ncbi:MAG TPA: LAGLIDADG family homing endonuclease, partial [bacterium]|nr:LAGLIDADG family homing endonuclease [bacterium]
INPYRGCVHGCIFCLWGDTPILMADGTTKSLHKIAVGDEIFGTVREGRYRRYRPTKVLACWSTVKEAYRITLADGTELIASGDHRFLSDRGWRFVVGAEQGPLCRPHLTVNSRLMGTGSFAARPSRDEDYERGYLCGMVRGDGSLGLYESPTAVSVETRVFSFQPAAEKWRAVRIRTAARGQVEMIQRIIAWPDNPPDGWCKGFLAGIFDAEGGTTNGSLRIATTNPVMIAFIQRCLRRLGFRSVVEQYDEARGKPIAYVRLCGGLGERLRFFQTVEPAISTKRHIVGHALKNTSIPIASIEPIGARELFDITTGTGDFIANGMVSHNCFARRTHWFLDEDGVGEWSSKIFVKVNAPELLRRELARPSWRREDVALGTATDPYQALEGKYRLTRRILEALRDFRTPVNIITRSPLICNDVDVLAGLAKRAKITVCISIATTDPHVAREIEPTVALPEHRFRTIETLTAAGIRAGVMLAPILPGLTDSRANINAVVREARAHGADFVSGIVLHLGDVTRDAFFQFLGASHPALVPRYLRMYRGKYAPDNYRAGIHEVVDAAKKQYGIQTRRYLEPEPEPAQLPLFDG